MRCARPRRSAEVMLKVWGRGPVTPPYFDVDLDRVPVVARRCASVRRGSIREVGMDVAD